MNRQSKTSVVICDDHPVFRDGVRSVLMACGQFEVVGEASNGMSSVQEALVKMPDLLLLDFCLPDFSGIEVLRRLREARAQTKVLFLTAGMDRHQTLDALQLGARGVLTKDASSELLVKAIRCVVAGEYWIGRGIMSDWLDLSRGKKTPTQLLTVREREIANQVLTGKTNHEIARALAIGAETVKRHIRNIYEKCGISSRVELAIYLQDRSRA